MTAPVVERDGEFTWYVWQAPAAPTASVLLPQGPAGPVVSLHVDGLDGAFGEAQRVCRYAADPSPWRVRLFATDARPEWVHRYTTREQAVYALRLLACQNAISRAVGAQT